MRPLEVLTRRGVVHLPLFVVSLKAALGSICSLAWTVDWPAVNLFEISARSIRAIETPRLLYS